MPRYAGDSLVNCECLLPPLPTMLLGCSGQHLGVPLAVRSLAKLFAFFASFLQPCSTKYGWIYIKQTQNDNLTSDPPSALLRAGA